MNRPVISIIIVNWDQAELLAACLASIAEQTYRHREVIVVDNGSTDGSVALVREKYPDAKLIVNDVNRGFCAANNQGIAEALGQYALLLNNDTVLEPDAIERLVEEMAGKPEDCIGLFPKVMFMDVPRVFNGFGVVWNHRQLWRDLKVGQIDLGQFDRSERVFGSIFPAVLFKTDKLLEIGGFDEEHFSYAEDFDLCYRANALGYSFYTAPRAVIYHKYRASSGEKTDTEWAYGFFVQNYLYTILKNYQFRNLLLYFPSACWRFLLRRLLVSILVGNAGRRKTYAGALKGLLQKGPAVLRWRRFIARNRKVDDKVFWDFRSLPAHNPFHYEDAIVLSEYALRVAKRGEFAPPPKPSPIDP